MGLEHGSDFDCSGSSCSICTPFRLIEKKVWDGLNEEQKKEVVLGVFDL